MCCDHPLLQGGATPLCPDYGKPADRKDSDMTERRTEALIRGTFCFFVN